MKAYLLGIDIGGTMVKAALYDQHGLEMAVKSQPTQLITPMPGYTERDMDELWLVTAAVIRETVTKAGVDPVDIVSVACSGHGKGLYLWGKDDRPARNGIISTDTRAGKYVEQWDADGTSDCAHEKTIQRVLVSQPCSLLAWIRDNEPDVYANIQWIFEVKDYIRFRLTGAVFGELTDYSGTNLVNMYSRAYDDKLLQLFGLSEIRDCLPPLVSSLDQCGVISHEAAVMTGLQAGTPVAGGMFDIDACAIASGVTDSKNLCVIAGTWSINEYISKRPVTDKSIAMNSVFCIPEYYLIEECSPTSAGNLDWFIKSVLSAEVEKANQEKKNVFAEFDILVDQINPADCRIIYLPYIYGSPENPSATGCFVGLTSYHTKVHVVRAVFEGIVFGHLDHIRKLLSSRDLPDCIRLAGGAAKSAVWTQMFADICGLPVEAIPVKELGTLGCAINGAVTAGIYDSIDEAVEQMVPSAKRFEPDTSHFDIYQEKYRSFRAVADALAQVWPDI